MSANKSIDEDVMALMMSSLDGESTPEQEAQLQQMLAKDETLREEYRRFEQMKEITMKSRIDPPPQEIWDTYWTGVYARIERGVGWVLFSFGAISLLLFGAWEMSKEWITNPEIPLWVKAGGICLGTGTIILLVSVVREKIFLHKHERYKDVTR